MKQYQRLFEFENVRLKFSDDANRAIARQAMARKVGARGLRMILEELMLELMYSLPSQKKVKEFEVTREMVEKRNVSLAMIEKAASKAHPSIAKSATLGWGTQKTKTRDGRLSCRTPRKSSRARNYR